MYQVSESFFFVWKQFFKGHHNIWVTFRHAVLKFAWLRIKEIDAMTITICFHLQEATDKEPGKVSQAKYVSIEWI